MDRNAVPEIPDFDLIRPIGRGGFGDVWLASNRTTGHLRAVKVIALSRSGRADAAGREVTSLTRLEANLRRRHPNLLIIHHVGKTSDHLFYVMDLADDVSGAAGTADESYHPATLQSLLDRGPFSPEACWKCTQQLLAGLASLHEAGMVHRDVKPANCLLVDGELKLADFGLLTEANPQVSRLGTERYMPPDGRMDARADVYAAGLAVYEMLSGLPAERFPHLGQRAEEVAGSPTLCTLVQLALRACQPDPAARFADARAMLAELTKSRAEAAAQSAVRSRRRVWLGLTGAAAALAAVVLAATAYWLSRPARVDVNFTTRPFEAAVFLDGVEQQAPDGTPCRTPCTIDSLPVRGHHVVFKRHGLLDLDAGQIDFATVRQIDAKFADEPAGDQ